MILALGIITVVYSIALAVVTIRSRRKARRLALASVLRRVEGCGKRHCTCVR